MSRKNILLALSQGIWAIQPEFARVNGLVVKRILSGEKAFEKDTDEEAELIAYSVDISGAVTFGSKYNPFENAQPGSTAVIGITGPIMKYDNCGDPGTKTYGALLDKAYAHPNINSAILIADSPGGTVDGTMELATKVKSFSEEKPIIAFVDGLAASAMYWIASACTEIIALNETSSVGSIGTMISFPDMRGYWEEQGVTFHDVYADKSVDKNKDYHDMLKGDYALIKQKLNALNENFLSAVSENRTGKINTKKENVLTGKMYLAPDALSAGLIDAIGNLDFAVNRAQQLTKADPSTQNTQNENMKKITLLATHAALLAACGATIAEGKTSVDVELTDDVVSKIDSALASAKTTTAKAETDLANSTTELTASKKDLATANAKILELEADVKKFGGESAGETRSVKSATDKIEANTDDEFLTSIDRERMRLKANGII